MQIISELEGYRRGPYAGAVGYRLPDGSLDTCIAIRTIVLADGVAHLQAGAGIVADSNPQAEHEECLRKLAALETALNLAEAATMKVLLVDNYDSFTYNLAHLLEELGGEVVVRRNDEVDAAGAAELAPTHLVVSPGPGRPEDSGATLDIVRAPRADDADARRLPRPPGDRRGLRRRDRPGASGCCTGRRPRSSTTAAGIFAGLPQGFSAGRYHSLAATRIPDELEVSARRTTAR